VELSPDKLKFSGEKSGAPGDFTALPENVAGEICLPITIGASHQYAP
jgi:hypothetical protein